MRRILVVGDSNCFARSDGYYRDTWLCKLREAIPGCDVVGLIDAGRMTDFLIGREALEVYEPDLVILQLGIVDGTPRLFTRNESRVLAYTPAIIRKLIIGLAKLLRKRSVERAYVPPERFETNIRQYVERCRCPLIVVGIADSRERTKGAVEIYNGILKRYGTYVEAPHGQGMYLEDGYHLSSKGHAALFESLLPMVLHGGQRGGAIGQASREAALAP